MVETSDNHDRIILVEKFSLQEELLFCEKTFYDLDGNIVKTCA